MSESYEVAADNHPQAMPTVTCEHMVQVGFENNSGKFINTCNRLTSALGWTHGFAHDKCVECVAATGGCPPDPTTGGADPLSQRFRFMVLHPLRIYDEEDTVVKMLGIGREATVAKAIALGLPRDDIAAALAQGVKVGLAIGTAESLLERFCLLDKDD